MCPSLNMNDEVFYSMIIQKFSGWIRIGRKGGGR
jgi:hypothetical protein